MKELLDEEGINPEKLFDKEQYNTLTLAINSETKYSESDIDILLDLLNEHITREDKDLKLAHLKEKKLHQLLIKAIHEADNNIDKAKLFCICWESGLDFKDDYLFFIENACDDDFLVALEAFTVAENIEHVTDEKTLTKAIEIIDNCNSGNKQILADLKQIILSNN